MNIDDIGQTLKNEIAKAVNAELDRRALPAVMPKLIELQDAAVICTVSKSSVEDLFNDAERQGFPTGGFPGIRLGPRTMRIDERRLIEWLARGGLNVNEAEQEKIPVPEHPIRKLNK